MRLRGVLADRRRCWCCCCCSLVVVVVGVGAFSLRHTGQRERERESIRHTTRHTRLELRATEKEEGLLGGAEEEENMFVICTDGGAPTDGYLYMQFT